MILSEDDRDTKAITRKLNIANAGWGRLAGILKRDGADYVTMSRFYLTIVQAILLYGADSWTVTQDDLR